MTEKYILVGDDEYCYILDTSDENYKTLEDFEKQEFENAKKDNVDIKEYEEEILLSASDKYWDWVYNNHLEADTVNYIMNMLYEENKQLKKCNKQLSRRSFAIKGICESKCQFARKETDENWICLLERTEDNTCDFGKVCKFLEGLEPIKDLSECVKMVKE